MLRVEEVMTIILLYAACMLKLYYIIMRDILVQCPPLTNPNNGVINCSLGDDGFPSYEDTCSFTCNTDYELTGSDTRTCQSNGSWSSTDVMCIRGKESSNCYHIAQKFDGKNFDELIIGFKGETLRDKGL